MYPASVEITEVGMRDGFQMESLILPTGRKTAIGSLLINAGVSRIEATSFVSPVAVPQLADAASLIESLKGRGAELSALVPNVSGARRAAAAGTDRITVFVSASETHNMKNVRRSVTDSIAGLDGIGEIARDNGIPMSGDIATAFGCPFEGNIAEDALLRLVDAYGRLGVDTVALGDTTGMATPPIVERAVTAIQARFPDLQLALHFHNTRGLGLVNVMTGLQLGIRRFESSIGGLGGCPFAIGATGNIATEDLVHLLDELGIETGIDLTKLIEAARAVEATFDRILPGQVMKAGPRLTLAKA